MSARFVFASASIVSSHRSSPWRLAESLHLADVMHHAVEQPLRVHLLLAAQAQPPEPVGAADVGEHRLDRPEPPAVLIAALLGVDLALHTRAGVVRFDPPDEQHHLARSGALRVAQTPMPQRAGATVALGALEDQRTVAVRTVVLATAVELLAGWADTGPGGRVELKVLRPKQPVRIGLARRLVPLGRRKARVALPE